jgi:hypothetical protein
MHAEWHPESLADETPVDRNELNETATDDNNDSGVDDSRHQKNKLLSV